VVKKNYEYILKTSTTIYKPIGVFDSGYGGLTILKEIVELLPEYDYIYLGDNARTPYGSRSYEVVYQYTLQAVRTLFDMGCELVILACNTASAKALRTIQQNDLPKINATKRVLGVIRPSVEAVAQYTLTKNVGILGTIGTVNSMSYPLEINKLYPDISIFQESCPMWVPLVENNEYESDGADYFIRKNIAHLLSQNQKIDVMILACTHYPLLLPKIMKYVPQTMRVLSQGDLVSASLQDYLHRHPEMDINCSKNGILKFYTTENAETFAKQGSQFLQRVIKADKIEMFEHLNLKI